MKNRLFSAVLVSFAVSYAHTAVDATLQSMSTGKIRQMNDLGLATLVAQSRAAK